MSLSLFISALATFIIRFRQATKNLAPKTPQSIRGESNFRPSTGHSGNYLSTL